MCQVIFDITLIENLNTELLHYMFKHVSGCPPTAEALMFGVLQLQKKVKYMKTVQTWYRK